MADALRWSSAVAPVVAAVLDRPAAAPVVAAAGVSGEEGRER